jgi:hypothetical protein
MRRALGTLFVVAAFAGIVWAADVPPAGGETKAPEMPTATGIADQSLVQDIQRNLTSTERRVAHVQKASNAAATDDIKAAAQALVASEQTVIEKLKSAVDAAAKGRTEEAKGLRQQALDMRKENRLVSMKYEVLSQNERYKGLIAQAPDNAEIKGLVDKLVKTNLEILDVETQLAKTSTPELQAQLADITKQKKDAQSQLLKLAMDSKTKKDGEAKPSADGTEKPAPAAPDQK